MEVYFTGSARLFNRDLGLRSLNRRPAQTLSDCVAGTVSVLTSVSRLSECLGWCAGRLRACWLTDCLMSLGGCLQIKRRDLDVKNTRSWLKLAFFFLRPSSWWLTRDNNARSPKTIQQRRCLGLITVGLNCLSLPIVVWVHIAASKQLFSRGPVLSCCMRGNWA